MINLKIEELKTMYGDYFDPRLIGTTRDERAVKILKNPKAIKRVKKDVYVVKSQTGIGEYRVEVNPKSNGWKCNCPDHIQTKLRCKHIISVELDLESKGLNNRVVQPSEWTFYNQAQMNEIELFDMFLFELANMVEDTENGVGRPKTPIADLIFCAVQKEYTQLSLRREHTLYKRAVEKNKISRVVGINAVSSFLNKEENTPILRHLLCLSASPMASIETKFAIDSTGFRTTNYTEWCKEKHRTGKKNDWIKAHISIGTITNVITDMIVTGSNSADTKEFIPLVEGTMQYFDIEQITADKGYLSRQNYDFGKTHGFDVFIPFKSNTTGKQGGSITWGNAYWNFKNNNGYFMKQYHVRSNVESTFSSMKKKFGDSIKSRNYTAQVNELYCMAIAENITMLIRAMYSHNIDVCFNSSN